VLAKQRQATILDHVQRRGAVRVSELIDLLGVSDMTVRRDITALERRGVVQKVHGGVAALPERATHEPDFRTKSLRELDEKQAIARRATELVTPGTAIAISAGTTTYALATFLLDVPRLTIVTNNVPVADLLHERGRHDQTVVLVGGVRTPSDALVGPVAVSTIRTLHVDVFFMGVHGMDVHAGFTSPNLLEAEANRALVDTATRLVVLADHTKHGVVGLSAIAPLARADVLVTDDGLAADAAAELAEHVGRLETVRVAGRPVVPGAV